MSIPSVPVVNLYIEPGIDYSITIQFVDKTGTPIPLDSLDPVEGLIAQMAKTPYTTERIAFDMIVTNASLGIATMNMYSTTSAMVSPGLYLYDIQLRYASGQKLFLQKGEVTIAERISRFTDEGETSPFYQPDQIIDGGVP